MKTKHTPGPWKLGKPFGILDPKKQWVGEPCFTIFGNDETDSKGPSAICGALETNAHLIAAAPEMLTVLERVDKHFRIMAVGSLHDPNVEALRETLEWIIKKAKGEL